MELVGHGEAAGQLAVEADVGGIGHVRDAHLAGDGGGALVDAARKAGVRVAVDDAGRDVLAGGVDDPGVRRRGEVLTDGADLAILDEQVGVFQAALRSRGPHGGAAHEHRRRGGEVLAREAEGAGRIRGGQRHGRLGLGVLLRRRLGPRGGAAHFPAELAAVRALAGAGEQFRRGRSLGRNQRGKPRRSLAAAEQLLRRRQH